MSKQDLEARLSEAERRIDACEAALRKCAETIKALKSQNRGYKSGVPIDEVLVEPTPPDFVMCDKCEHRGFIILGDGKAAYCECRTKYDETMMVYKEQYALWRKKKATEERRAKRDEREIQKAAAPTTPTAKKTKTGIDLLDNQG